MDVGVLLGHWHDIGLMFVGHMHSSVHAIYAVDSVLTLAVHAVVRRGRGRTGRAGKGLWALVIILAILVEVLKRIVALVVVEGLLGREGSSQQALIHRKQPGISSCIFILHESRRNLDSG
jgi:hypothetical protein